jgi:hypothetical protein
MDPIGGPARRRTGRQTVARNITWYCVIALQITDQSSRQSGHSTRKNKKVIVTQTNVTSGHLLQKGQDTKMNWPTDRRSQYNLKLRQCSANYGPVLSSERAPYMKNKVSNCHSNKCSIWSPAPKGARHQDELADWLSVVMWLWLDVSWFRLRDAARTSQSASTGATAYGAEGVLQSSKKLESSSVKTVTLSTSLRVRV